MKTKNNNSHNGVVKLIIAIIFILGAFGAISDGFGPFIICLLIGLLFLVWYLWPVLRLHIKAYQERKLKQKDQEQERRHEEETRNAAWHLCPNCGANFQGTQCPYCRTHITE